MLCNEIQGAQGVENAEATSLASGRNADGSDARYFFADAHGASRQLSTYGGQGQSPVAIDAGGHQEKTCGVPLSGYSPLSQMLCEVFGRRPRYGRALLSLGGAFANARCSVWPLLQAGLWSGCTGELAVLLFFRGVEGP